VGLDISKEIQSITKQIIEKYKPDRIILFGSAARGELEPDIDADFLIIKKETPLYGAHRIRQLSQLINRTSPWTSSSTVQKNLNNDSKWEIPF